MKILYIKKSAIKKMWVNATFTIKIDIQLSELNIYENTDIEETKRQKTAIYDMRMQQYLSKREMEASKGKVKL